MKTNTITPQDWTIKLIGGIKVRLAMAELRYSGFSGFSHVAVSYLETNGKEGYGWIPTCVWDGGNIISTCRTQMTEVWK